MTEEVMQATSVNLEIISDTDCRNLDVKHTYGTIDDINQCRYKLNFKEARGGKTYWLFPKMVIKDKSAETTNKVIISQNNKEILKISYNEILELEFREFDGKKFYQLKIK